MRKTFLEKCINLRLCRVALVLFFLVPAISSLQANPSQNKTISGVVTSATDSEPLIGVSVQVRETATGGITDIDGRYSVSAQQGQTLVFSYIGYQSQEIKVGTSSVINVVLKEDTEMLDEVVVVGYGVQKKKLVTGATVQVKGDEIAKMNTTNPLQAMQGQTPGVSIASTSGQPGADMKVSIRGLGTVGNSAPLYLIDGVGGDISTLNPADIESIDVLKDAASAAIYGSAGANGVVLITTKQGREGKAQISFDAYYGIQNVARKANMLNALTALGVSYTLSADRTRCEIIGNGGPLHAEGALELFLGNAGTAMRPLAAALCLGSNDIVLTGEPRMKERPIGHLVDALRLGGAKITYLEQENYPPLRLQGGFTGGNVDVDGSVSSQFLTALLMTAPLAPEDTVIRIKGDLVSKPYIDITLNLMKTFGVEIENQHYQQFVVKGGQSYQSPGTYLVEGDASSASYFLAAAAIKGGTVKVTGIGRNSMQGDIRFADVLEKMGATICWGDDYISCTRGELNAIDMDMNHIPDAAMTIATAALFAKGTTTLRNIYNWRVKETDRLFAMATELRKVGAEVEEGHDYIRITPPEKLNFAEIATYNDHRMAMCFSLVALSDTPVTILDPKCTAKTFPDYFEQLARISQAA